MNTKFGKLVDGKINYAPSALVTARGVKLNPTDASYLAEGWKRIINEPQGENCVVSRWEETHDSIIAVYENAPAAKKSRVFSKLKIVAKLTQLGKWESFKSWLIERHYYDIFLAAQEFVEDNPMFIDALETFKNVTGIEDSMVEEILNDCIQD